MYTIKRLTAFSDSSLATYQSLTIEPYKQMLANAAQSKQYIAVGVLFEENPVGLGIFVKYPEQKAAQLVSIFINKEHRHQHLGSQVLTLLEEELSQEKDTYQQVFARYPLGNETAPFFEKLILNHQWTLGETLLGGKIPNNVNFTWLKNFSLPSQYEFFNWKDLTESDREQIRQKHEKKVWNPNISPFDKEEDIDYLNSLGLRLNGELIGWMITHRIFPDVIQYWCLCIDSTIPNQAIGIYLLTEAMRLQLEAYPPLVYGLFLFRESQLTKTSKFLQFVKNKLLPYCVTKTYAREASKKLLKI